MKPSISIIIPTWNNPQFLNPCIDSIIHTGCLSGLCELVIVNNGKQPIKEYVGATPNVRVLEPGKNLGWEGGLQYGLDNTDSDFVCFQNDDTQIPKATQSFYSQLLWPFNNTQVAAVGPATTVASGWHSIFMKNPIRALYEVPYLIFFTVMVRRSDLLAAGGIDVTAPGGDDFDVSIRLRKLGKSLIINPDAFIIHHGFKSGERLRGTSDQPDGWNSKEMTDRTNQWLIRKHGFKTFMETRRGFDYESIGKKSDSEGELVATFVRGPSVIELGCGFRKTVPEAIGIDQAGPGDDPTHLTDGKKSVADIKADVTEPLPLEDGSQDTLIARHILEHCVNIVDTLKHWKRVLKVDGRMIIAVPDHTDRNTIPMNPEHVHGFTPESLKSVMELCGFRHVETVDSKNGVSFVACYEKVAVREPAYA